MGIFKDISSRFIATLLLFLYMMLDGRPNYVVEGISSVTFQTITMATHQDLYCNKRPWWYSEVIVESRDHTEFVHSSCPPGYFILSNMITCHPWLGCSDLNSVEVNELIGYGAVKAVYRANWNGISIAYSMLNNFEYKEDFLHGISMLKIFSPSPVIVQLIGYCENEYVLLTEYHQHGNAVNITSLLKTYNDTVIFRLELCLNYARLLEYLHNSPAGIRVFCDSNDLVKLLSQLLVTDELALLLSDLDALPEVSANNNFLIKCGHREIKSSFVAPEQLWPYNGSFDDDEMIGYNEKTDIWKAAAVCKYFVGNEIDSNVAWYHLFSVHNNCRKINSSERPSAQHLVSEYAKIIAVFGKTGQ